MTDTGRAAREPSQAELDQVKLLNQHKITHWNATGGSFYGLYSYIPSQIKCNITHDNGVESGSKKLDCQGKNYYFQGIQLNGATNTTGTHRFFFIKSNECQRGPQIYRMKNVGSAFELSGVAKSHRKVGFLFTKGTSLGHCECVCKFSARSD